MFSKALLKLSSLAIKNSKVMTRTNSIRNTMAKSNEIQTKSSKFKYELPSLMKFESEKTQFPSMIPSKISFFYKLFVDKSYNEPRFIDQAKQTVSKISSHLANDDIEGIKSLVTKEAFEELSQNFAKFSSEQKNELKIEINDILQSFPLGLTVDRISENSYDVKILVLFEVLKDYSNSANQKILSHIRTKEFYDELPEFKLKLLEPLLNNKYICVYEFSREYGLENTKNWTVSRLTHFKYKDIWKLHGLIP